MSIDKEFEAPEVVAWYLSYSFDCVEQRSVRLDRPIQQSEAEMASNGFNMAGWYEPLMTVAQYRAHMAAKDAGIARLTAENMLLRGPEETVTSARGDKLFTFMSKDPCRYRLCEVTYAAPVRALIAERDELRAQLATDKARITSLEDYLPVVWRDGPPPHPWDQEWFIGLLDNDGRVVLKALPEEHSYDFRTADETYYSAFRIKMWAQFPDSEYVSAPAPQLAQQLTVKGCTKPGCFPYCDCGGVDDCTPARSLDRVVMPERKLEMAPTWHGIDQAKGWNACLDELHRLNGSKCDA